jgi:kumamolisin
MSRLEGSYRPSLGSPVGTVAADETLHATVVLRPVGPDDHRAADEDVAAVRAFAERNGVEVEEVDPGARTVRLRGSASSLTRAFDTELKLYEVDGRHVRGREGTLALPDDLDGTVVAVLGLDNRPAAAPRFRPAAAAPSGLTAVQVAHAYQFPAATGAGQIIAIIELGGGFGQADLDTYFRGLGLTSPTVTAVGVEGAQNVPEKDPNGADGEVLLDIEVAGAVAPGAKQVVYFAPNTDAGFLAAVNAAAAASPPPVAISISWGGPESSWTRQSMQAYDQAFAAARAKGIVVLAAAGDAGAKDSTSAKVADFPASSPNVIACGGTRLGIDSSGAWASEVVWDDGADSSTGGGYSSTFNRPSWQPTSVGQYRGVPDISANADPESGYRVVVDGSSGVIGGTSAVAPLLAGLAARLAQLTGKPVGTLATVAYANPGAFTDITSGGNEGWSAGTGWDPASGLGSPVGAKLLAAFGQTNPPPTGADATLWSATRSWAKGTHAGSNARAAKAVLAWASAKGFS